MKRFYPGMRDTVKGAKGAWCSSRNGGIWFRPDGWKPKVHLSADDATLCGKEIIGKPVLDAAQVTCGSCLNQIRIRNFRAIMFFAAFLLWARLHPKQLQETSI
ncbi:MAG: hypothetical protein A2Y38_19965 [Spirochaetes bacterium GWB1_59_5]|nr:MAG: hypothetical protein A2Y38_19965 [Spirochaetes bacterium GWB1_59_5]